jgi:hypothetical protein
MSRLEEYALPIIEPLVLNQPQLIDLPGQLALASVLALVSTRIEFTARGMRTIPREELDKIRLGGLPSRNWRVWIARFIGPDLKDYRYNYTAMQIADDPSAAFGAEHCNTQVTTLIIGQLYVHMLFSTVWPNFQGYEGVELTQIWPPAGAYIEARLLPPMDETHGILLHETISRLGKMPGGI